MEHGEMLHNRDRAVVEIDTPVVTRAMLEAYPRLEILVLLPSVGHIERDALLNLPTLETVVVDVKSESRPEECDYGIEGERYRHVHVFRLDTTHPPLVSLPDTVFLEGYPVPVLLHSEGAGVGVDVSDGRTLASTREGYEVQTLQFGRGEYAVGDVGIRVLEWGGKGCGVPEGKEGSVELQVPYGVEVIGEKQYFENRALRSVHIPPTVKVVGEEAFQSCANLTAVTLTGVREIGDYAFQYTDLTEATIPSSVERVGGWSFNHCESLTSVEIDEGVQSIGHLNQMPCLYD